MTDDSMSDDVFEAEEPVGISTSASSISASTTGGLNVLSNQSHRTPSPTGYKDYQPPPELFEAPKTYVEEIAHKTILLGDSGVGKTSLLVQFDTGKFKGGSFAATVGIGFMEVEVDRLGDIIRTFAENSLEIGCRELVDANGEWRTVAVETRSSNSVHLRASSRSANLKDFCLILLL